MYWILATYVLAMAIFNAAFFECCRRITIAHLLPETRFERPTERQRTIFKILWGGPAASIILFQMWGMVHVAQETGAFIALLKISPWFAGFIGCACILIFGAYQIVFINPVMEGWGRKMRINIVTWREPE